MPDRKRMKTEPWRGFGWLAAGALLFQGIPAHAKGENVARLRVLSFNTWHDGTRVENGFEKIAKAIAQSGADVACLQESSAGTARRLAERLGWHAVEGGGGSVQMVSRYPVAEVITGAKPGSDRMIGARFRLDGHPEAGLVVFNLHLDFRHYGPYAAQMAGATAASVLEENARSERVAQMRGVLETMRRFLDQADGDPVILTGDFNVPSHLDWTESTAAAHGGVGPVAWPESMMVEKAGLADSFRTCHPDPALTPGNTWSAIHKGEEPQDRIDFIYHLGSALRVIDCKLFATAVETTVEAWGDGAEAASGNTWPSDHSAVLATYERAGGARGEESGKPGTTAQNPSSEAESP